MTRRSGRRPSRTASTPCSPRPGGAWPVLQHFGKQPEVAGFWDDCYVTQDYAHTRMLTAWSAAGVHLDLKGQFIHVGFGMADVATGVSATNPFKVGQPK